jgi:hypothetical protein
MDSMDRWKITNEALKALEEIKLNSVGGDFDHTKDRNSKIDRILDACMSCNYSNPLIAEEIEISFPKKEYYRKNINSK